LDDPWHYRRARELAREAVRGSPGKLTVREVAEQWLERKVRKNEYRTAPEMERVVNQYIVPRIGNHAFTDVRRKDIAELLDRIEDDHGKQMADGVLKVYRAMSRWWQQRDEDYNPPLTSGMSRVAKGEGRRKRILGDDEIRAVWGAAGQYGDFVRLALLDRPEARQAPYAALGRSGR
jgi:integrase